MLGDNGDSRAIRNGNDAFTTIKHFYNINHPRVPAALHCHVGSK